MGYRNGLIEPLAKMREALLEIENNSMYNAWITEQYRENKDHKVVPTVLVLGPGSLGLWNLIETTAKAHKCPASFIHDLYKRFEDLHIDKK